VGGGYGGSDQEYWHTYFFECLLEGGVLFAQQFQLVSESGVVDGRSGAGPGRRRRRHCLLDGDVLRPGPHRPRVRLAIALQHLSRAYDDQGETQDFLLGARPKGEREWGSWGGGSNPS